MSSESATERQLEYLKSAWGVETACTKEQASSLITRLKSLDEIGDDIAREERQVIIDAAKGGANIDTLLGIPPAAREPETFRVQGFLIRIRADQRESLSHKESRTTTGEVIHPKTGAVLHTETIRDTVNYLRKPKAADVPPWRMVRYACERWISEHQGEYPLG